MIPDMILIGVALAGLVAGVWAAAQIRSVRRGYNRVRADLVHLNWQFEYIGQTTAHRNDIEKLHLRYDRLLDYLNLAEVTPKIGVRIMTKVEAEAEGGE